LRFCVTLLGGHAKPDGCFTGILDHAPTLVVRQSKEVLRFGVPLLGGRSERF